ncbi:hypothetical protein HanIR_Chr04g0163851 [Helianthus annuus]|nr:hypothetical protein HanIR_Chr04g0163851 [Helianthus annuus]
MGSRRGFELSGQTRSTQSRTVNAWLIRSMVPFGNFSSCSEVPARLDSVSGSLRSDSGSVNWSNESTLVNQSTSGQLSGQHSRHHDPVTTFKRRESFSHIVLDFR